MTSDMRYNRTSTQASQKCPQKPLETTAMMILPDLFSPYSQPIVWKQWHRERKLYPSYTFWKMYPPGLPQPTTGSLEGAALTRGWELMVKKPWRFASIRSVSNRFVSGDIKSSHHGVRSTCTTNTWPLHCTTTTQHIQYQSSQQTYIELLT